MSELESLLALQIRADKLPEPTREHKFHPTRRWRFDFCWPDYMLAVEAEGAVWANGRHTRGAGYVGDMEKYNHAALLGWIVLRFDSKAIKDGSALNMIKNAIKIKHEHKPTA